MKAILLFRPFRNSRWDVVARTNETKQVSEWKEFCWTNRSKYGITLIEQGWWGLIIL